MGALYEQQEKFRKAGEAYELALSQGSTNPDVVLSAANCLWDCEQIERAEVCVGQFLRSHPEAASLTLCNIHAELLVALKRWTSVLSTIDSASQQIGDDGPLPPELILKKGQALFHTQQTDSARSCFTELFDASADSHGDLLCAAGDICTEFSQHGASW